MKVAILLSTYNGEKYLNDQIESLKSQKGDFQIQIIVRDDGSTDKTIEILDEYKRKGVLDWYSSINLKPAKSFMDLLYDCGEYDFYCFCDQDDVWDSDKVKIGIKKIIDIERPCIYYSNVELVNCKLESYGQNLYKRNPSCDIYTVMCSPNVIGCTMIMNKLLVSCIRMHEKPKVISMHDSFVSRVCLTIGGIIIYDNEPHMKYRQHDNNVIGIKTSFGERISVALERTMKQSSVTIDNQAKEIMRIFSDDISQENKEWLQVVIGYRKNFFTRFALAVSNKPRYISKKMSIQMRLAILLGNR